MNLRQEGRSPSLNVYMGMMRDVLAPARQHLLPPKEATHPHPGLITSINLSMPPCKSTTSRVKTCDMYVAHFYKVISLNPMVVKM